MLVTMKKKLRKEIFEHLYENSAYTIIGVDGIQEWIEGVTKLLEQESIGTPTLWYTFLGEDMNEFYSLTGSNRYPDDLHFLAFDIIGLDIGKLAMFKLVHRDRWFDDIVDNNAIAEHGFPDEDEEDSEEDY